MRWRPRSNPSRGSGRRSCSTASTGCDLPPGLSAHVYGRWLFSHEEDGARVYRPRGSDFAPSRRPRDGFDIEADGGFRAYTPGAADASEARDGRWEATGEQIRVAYADGGDGLALEIVEAAPGMLKLRRV